MNIILDILSKILSIAVVFWIIFRVYQLRISEKTLKTIIQDHLNIDSNHIESISRLSFTERIKYGVPGSVFGMYNYFFCVFTGKLEYTRRVDIMAKPDQESIRFISITIKNRRADIIKVFDSYNL